MEIYRQLISVFSGHEGKVFSTGQIKSMVADKYNTNKSSVIPSDYCYNRLNKGSRPYYFFERINHGQFKFIGENFNYSGDIFARPKGANEDIKVGYWENGARILSSTPTSDHKHFIQPEDDDNFYYEGKEAFRLHRSRERHGELPKQKKQTVIEKYGSLKCEICRFDFAKVYGTRGDGFIECHHNKPVSDMKGEEKVSINDLSLLCSNCHRIIHRYKPWISVKDLRELWETLNLKLL